MSGAALDAFYEEIERATWLRPDAELDAMGPPAVRFLEERLDEHAAAVAHWVEPAGEPLALTLWVTRSAREAAARWSSEWDPDGSLLAGQKRDGGARARETFGTPQLAVDLRWREALQRAHDSYATRAKAHPRRHLALEELKAALRTHVQSAARRSVDWIKPPPKYGRRDAPPFAAALRCARDLQLRSLEDPEAPAPACPWAPLMALWNRGAWPFALRGGTLGVFVPVTGEKSAGSPDDRWWSPSFRELPVVPFLPRSVDGFDPVTELLGFDFPAHTPQSVRDFHTVRGPLAPPELPDRAR